MMRPSFIIALCFVSTIAIGFPNLPGVLSPLPPMGYNNWARTMGNINESLFVDTLEAMLEKGFLQAGYRWINLDDAWSKLDRAANGSMQINEARFPRGFYWLTDFIKSKGFRPGIYTDAGYKSCEGVYPGAFGYEEIDAHDFAAWGFEYVKLDGCNMPEPSEATYRAAYKKWSSILRKMENPMIFSQSAPAYFAEPARPNLTDWYNVMTWVAQYGTLARHSRDTLVWNSTLYWPDIRGWDSVMFNYGKEVLLARFQRPGFYNDPDFLNVDHFDYTLDEKKSHFALWCSFSAPLILSTDMVRIRPEEVEYLQNKELIAVNQDPLVQQATLVSQDGTWDVLTKSLYNGDRLVTILNRGDDEADYSVSLSRIGIPPTEERTDLLSKNLWTGEINVLPASSSSLHISSVPSHGTAVFRLSNPIPLSSVRTQPTGMIFNTFSLKCLTDSLCGTVSWSNCTAADSQVWRVRPDGTVSSLALEDRCVAAVAGRARSQPCGVCTADESRGRTQLWSYGVSGNLRSRASGRCLTERAGGLATMEECGYLTNEQVLGLPVGVEL